MFDLSAATGDPVQTLLLASLEIEIAGQILANVIQANRSKCWHLLDTAVGQSRHPVLCLVLAVFQPFGDTGPSGLLNEWKIDHRAGIFIVINQFPLVGAATARDFSEKTLSSPADAICCASDC
jgi:hypothetical protein